MKKELTLEQKIFWAEACCEIESEYALHAYYHRDKEGRDPDDPTNFSAMRWSKERLAECVNSHGFGACITYDHADGEWSAGIQRQVKENFERMKKMHPKIADDPDLVAINGGCGLHQTASSVIEVADDCRSARASFYTPCGGGSNLAGGFPGRPVSKHKMGMWMWERYGTDWVFEDGEWKNLRNQIGMDFMGGTDKDNPAINTWNNLMDSGIVVVDMEGPHGIDFKGPTHYTYSPVQPPQYNMMPPVPYDTLSHTDAYIPKPGNQEKYQLVFEKEGVDIEDLVNRRGF